MPSPRPRASSPIGGPPQPQQAQYRQDERDEPVADAVQGPDRRVGEGGPVDEAVGADDEYAGQLERAAEQREPPCGARQRDGRHDVHDGRERGQQVRQWSLVELGGDLYTGPRRGREREESIDTDEYPAGS